MSQYTYRDRTVALAGLYQVAHIVHSIATTGMANFNDYKACVGSVFCESPERTEDVFGGVAALHTGLTETYVQLGGVKAGSKQPNNIELTRYVISLMVLERKIQKNPEVLKAIMDGAELAAGKQVHFGEMHENVIASLAHTYSQHISEITPRIIVKGAHGHLSNPSNANKIRALLLAGIRIAMLWRQVEGHRWQLFFRRGKYTEQCKAMLNEISEAASQIETDE